MWAVDRRTGKPTNEPEEPFHYSMDAVRYGIVGLKPVDPIAELRQQIVLDRQREQEAQASKQDFGLQPINSPCMQIIGRIEDEVHEYLNGTIEIADGVQYSQHRLVRRIALFENKTYPTGKTDKQGRYKYWYDIIGPRRDSEVKNLRVDSKHFLAFSDMPRKDFSAVFIANASIKQWMWDTGYAEQ